MKSKLVPTGIQATFRGKPFPSMFPFAALPGAGATAKIGWGPKGIQEIVNIFFGDIYFIPGKPFTGTADIHVHVPEILEPFKTAVPRLFMWEDYDQNVTVGWPVLTKGDLYHPSIEWRPFDQIYIDAPPLYLWRPIIIEPKLVNPFKNGLGMDVNVYIINPGPLYADFGILTTRLYHLTDEIAIVTVPEPVEIKNREHGGDLFGTNKINLQVRIKLSKNPLKAWKELIDILLKFRNYKVDIEASTPEYGRLEWLTTIFQHVGEDMKGHIFPFLIALLHNIKVSHLY